LKRLYICHANIHNYSCTFYGYANSQFVTSTEQIVRNYPYPTTYTNSDEDDLEGDGYAVSFTKGLHHDDKGLLSENAHYSTLVDAINQDAATNFEQPQRGITPALPAKTTFSGDALDKSGQSPLWRGWESPRAGHYFSVEGPDSDAVSLPPDGNGDPVPWPSELPVIKVKEGSNAEQLIDIKSTFVSKPITISSELNELAANISIGPDMAGVHFYTDYYESVRMGERITTGLLRACGCRIHQRLPRQRYFI